MLDTNTALSLKSDDCVYDKDNTKLIIKDYCVKFNNNGQIRTIIFGCLDKKNTKVNHPFYHLFLNPGSIKNSDKSFIRWSIDNISFIENNITNLDIIIKSYCEGFDNTLKYLAEDQLQK